MAGGYHGAVIFDVDGPLLDLTPPEEDAFFAPFRTLHGLTGLSRDWDSYRIRNDRDIIREILERHLGRDPDDVQFTAVAEEYERELRAGFASGSLSVSAIPGAVSLVETLADRGELALGIATANLRCAAELRLREAGLWDHFEAFPGTADGGGPKSDVLAGIVAKIGLEPDRIVFIGDNLNDLEAGIANRTHFIGFHVEESRRRRLSDHGARIVAGNHAETLEHITRMLAL